MKSPPRKKLKKEHASIESIGANFPTLRNAVISAAAAGVRRERDHCDSFRVNPMRILFGLFELTGHHQHHSKIFSVIHEAFRMEGTQLLSVFETNETEALSTLCLRLNRSIIDVAGTAHTCPAFVGCYNEDLGILSYFNAGHTPGLVRHISDTSELGETGLPLGLFSHTTNEASIIALEPGAAVIVVSKGVVETPSKGVSFGLERVKEALLDSRAANAHELCVSVLQAAHHFSSIPRPHQGLTALALVRNTL
jgi:hypothetical protein